MRCAEWGEDKLQSSRRLRYNKGAGANRRAEPVDLGKKRSSNNLTRAPNDLEQYCVSVSSRSTGLFGLQTVCTAPLSTLARHLSAFQLYARLNIEPP
jgi:hypothetical protein